MMQSQASLSAKPAPIIGYKQAKRAGAKPSVVKERSSRMEVLSAFGAYAIYVGAQRLERRFSQA